MVPIVPVVIQVINSNLDPACSWATGLDMALGYNVGPGDTMAPATA